MMGFHAFDPCLCVKFGVHFSLYAKTVKLLGSQKHQHLYEKAARLEDIGSFGLTELGHGSNVRNILTTAHYDKKTKEFIINTPEDLAMKWWIGAVANLANKSVIFAQLYLEDKYQGIHIFAVDIRDKKTHLPMAGVILGDCGPKNGKDGIDNGFIQFKNYRVPKDCHLDRFS